MFEPRLQRENSMHLMKQTLARVLVSSAASKVTVQKFQYRVSDTTLCCKQQRESKPVGDECMQGPRKNNWVCFLIFCSETRKLNRHHRNNRWPIFSLARWSTQSTGIDYSRPNSNTVMHQMFTHTRDLIGGRPQHLSNSNLHPSTPLVSHAHPTRRPHTVTRVASTDAQLQTPPKKVCSNTSSCTASGQLHVSSSPR